MNFKILCYFPIFFTWTSLAICDLSQLVTIRQIDRGEFPAISGSMLAHFAFPNASIDKSKQTHLVMLKGSPGTRNDFLACFLAFFAWKCLNRLRPTPTPAKPRRNPRLHTCPHTPNTRHVYALTTQRESPPPVFHRSSEADSRTVNVVILVSFVLPSCTMLQAAAYGGVNQHSWSKQGKLPGQLLSLL